MTMPRLNRIKLWLLIGGGGATLLAISWMAGGASGLAQGEYIGARACKLCHKPAYKSWLRNHQKHAKAFKNLPAEYRADGRCLNCHTTGYGKPGGFVSLAETPGLIAVQCEACHGPGSAHKKAAMDDPDDLDRIRARIGKTFDCVQCHKPHVNFKQAFELLDEGEEEELEDVLEETGVSLKELKAIK
jgi:hypothetical protein